MRHTTVRIAGARFYTNYLLEDVRKLVSNIRFRAAGMEIPAGGATNAELQRT